MEEVGRSWGWVLFFGLFTVVLGILVMVWPEATLKVFAILFGLQLLLVGIFRLVRSFSAGEQHRVWSIILGVIAIFLGVLVLRNIWSTVVLLTAILGVYWIIAGIIDFFVAVGDKRYPQRGFTIFLGIVQVIAGIVIVSYPTESATVMAWLLGIWFVILGILGIVMAFIVRGAGKESDVISAA
jgi:uncharacterized membrane protein HdeD (DUF308 family)